MKHDRCQSKLPFFLCVFAIACAAVLFAPPMAARLLAADQWAGGQFSADQALAKFGTQTEEITIDDARQYVLQLVNKERMARGVQPLEMDEYAQKVGQWHADDMAINRYVSHWDPQGFNPTMRYTSGGGNDGMGENVTFFTCGVRVYLTRKVVEYMHSQFMGSEGHRENLLRPEHNKLGVGIGFALFPSGDCAFTCDETFVDDYGELGALPQSIKLGTPVTVQGALQTSKAKFRYIGLGWEPLPKPIPPEAMNANLQGGQNPGGYNVELPKGTAPPKTSTVPTAAMVDWDAKAGKYFCLLDISRPLAGTPMPPDGQGGPGTPGVYYVFVWATLNPSLIPDGWPNRNDYYFLAGVWTLGGVN